jgi:hypothetical protein
MAEIRRRNSWLSTARIEQVTRRFPPPWSVEGIRGTTPRNLLRCSTIGFFKFSGIAQNLSNSPVEPDAIEGRVVLDNVSKQIRECLEHAEECAQQAAELPNGSPFRQDFLQLEKRWLELARSIEFGEQLDSFTKNSPKPNIKPNVLRKL